MGTIETTVALMSVLMRGQVLDRRSLARDFGMTVASADRYLHELAKLPGVERQKVGRRLLVRFSFGDALKSLGR